MAEEATFNRPNRAPQGGYQKRQRYKPNPDYVLKKRLPPRASKNPNDFYVTNKSDFKGQLAACKKLLEGGEEEIYVHGLGSAVTRAVNLALQLKEKLEDQYLLDVQTSTVKLVDDILPLTDQGSASTQERYCSAVHVRIFKTPEKEEGKKE